MSQGERPNSSLSTSLSGRVRCSIDRGDGRRALDLSRWNTERAVGRRLGGRHRSGNSGVTVDGSREDCPRSTAEVYLESWEGIQPPSDRGAVSRVATWPLSVPRAWGRPWCSPHPRATRTEKSAARR